MESVIRCDFCALGARRQPSVATEVTETGIRIELCEEHLDQVLQARAVLGLSFTEPLPLDMGSRLAARSERQHTH